MDYALHMVNRIEEVRRKELQKMQDDNLRRKKRGEKEIKIPDLWDFDFYKKCVLEMASSTGVAVFLSAITTVIGFSVLIAPTNCYCVTDKVGRCNIGSRHSIYIGTEHYFSSNNCVDVTL